jgi:hypothetical protein
MAETTREVYTLKLRERRGAAMPVKGMADSVEVYEVTGGPARTRFPAAAARGLTRFVGRDAEVEQLAMRWTAQPPGTGRSWPSWARPVLASRGCSMSSPTPTACRAG